MYTPAGIYPVAHLFRSGQVDAGNRQMCDHFKHHLSDIEKMKSLEITPNAPQF